MTPRTARFVFRSLLAVALAIVAVTGIVHFTSDDVAAPGQIVVVPASQEADIRDAAALLDDGCFGEVTNPALADAPTVYCDLEQRQAEGDDLVPGATIAVTSILVVVCLIWLGTGGLITSRQPGNLAGWLFQIVAISLLIEQLAFEVVFRGVKVDPGSIPLLGVWAMIGEYSLLAVTLLPMLWLLFPDGRPPTSRWRWGLRLYFGSVALAIMTFATSPGPLNNLVDLGIVYMNPLGLAALTDVVGGLTAVGVIGAMFLAVASVFGVRGRFKRAKGEERQQLRWLRFVTTIAAVLVVLVFGGGLVINLLAGDATTPVDGWFTVLLALLASTIAFGIPGAYLIAIFKHGLWDLDVVIKKTVRYAVLIAALLSVAVAIVVAIPAVVLGSAVDVDFWLVATLSVVLAGTFTWVREPARRLADRLVYGERATPYEVLSAFSERVGETYAADDVLPRMAVVLGQGTGAQRATVWLRVASRLRAEAVWPADVPPPSELPADAVEVTHQGESLGALSVEMPPDDPMNPAKEALLRDLAAQAGLVLRNVRLIEELRASRQRLVAAQDEERRKLERNIHDGVQQQLVALQVRQRLAMQLVERDPAKAVALLGELQGLTQETLEDLRDLARGIYPPLLADQGLVAALEAQARKAVTPTTVRAGEIERYRPEVEATVYFCCLESMNNIAKYARASRATIDLATTDGVVTFAVADDGDGFDPTRRGIGTGLQSIVDRVEALGGRAMISSSPGEGTTVRGEVPVGSGT